MDRDTMYDTMLRTAPSSAIMSWYEHLLGPTTQTLVPRHKNRSTLVHTYIPAIDLAVVTLYRQSLVLVLAVVMSDTQPRWRASPRCPDSLRHLIEKTVNAYPSEWLNPPQNGEVFDSIEECRQRLTGYSFS